MECVGGRDTDSGETEAAWTRGGGKLGLGLGEIPRRAALLELIDERTKTISVSTDGEGQQR